MNYLGVRKLNVLNSIAGLIKLSRQNQINSLQNQLSQEQSTHQQTKTQLTTEKSAHQATQKQAQQDRDNHQNQLNNQEQQIIQKLNLTFNLKLDSQEKDLNQAIIALQKLISKDPIVQTVDNSALQKELAQAQQTITLLKEQLVAKTPFGQSLEIIRETDEKLLGKLLTLQTKLSQQTKDYEELAKERNELLFAAIKKIELKGIKNLLPHLQELKIKAIQQTNNYQSLALERNNLIQNHLDQVSDLNIFQLQEQQEKNKKERIIWASSLATVLIVMFVKAKIKRTKRTIFSNFN